MEKKSIGAYIRQRRLELNLTQEELCGNFCAPSTLSMIESGKREPSIHVATYLLQKLGLSEKRFLVLLGQGDMDLLKLKEDIQNDTVLFGRAGEQERARIRSRILRMLKMLKSQDPDDTYLRQFALSTMASVGTSKGPYSPEERMALLLEAIRLTIPAFDPDHVLDFRYSMQEIILINQIMQTCASSGNRKEALRIARQLLRYIEKNNKELDRYSGQFTLVAHNYAIYLGLEKQYEKAARLAEKGRKVCLKYGDYQLLPGFTAILAECYFFMGKHKKSAEFYMRACHLYQEIEDEHNFEIIEKEMKERLGLEMPDLSAYG